MVASSTWRAGPQAATGSDLAMAAPVGGTCVGPVSPAGVLGVSNLTLQMFNCGRRVFMILNYYCFEINGRLSHVRPCMICGESAELSPGPAPSQRRPRDHEGDQQTQEQTAPADFFFFLREMCVIWKAI